MPTANLERQKAELIREGTARCQLKIDDFERGTLEPAPGCTAEQTLESFINGELSNIRTEAGEVCKTELHFLNPPLTMATCGSKGSFVNISQMIACVGQQSVGGKRMPANPTLTLTPTPTLTLPPTLTLTLTLTP
jgi:DNA-directed RNA polymerase III subunit RPC1